MVYVALGASDAVGVGVSNPATQKTEMRLQIERWKAGIAALASKYDVTLVDLYGHNSQLTAHPEYVSADGFHPSAAGYAQLANYFWQAIKQ